MNELSDQDLLREYAHKGSESAFAILVQRHIDLVYSAAHRIVVDPHLAEDVTQAVFIAAAREARKLQNCTVISAWLHRVARNHAAMTVRSEVRRRAREQRIAEMTNDTAESAAVCEQLAPVLDDCVEELRAEERAALMLRFFERRTARQIGERLGLTEEAAQKRVTRALERLRETLALRGISTSCSSLAGALALGVMQAAPVSLAASVAAQAACAAGSASVLSSTVTFMASHKVQMSLLAAVAAGLGGSVLYQRSANLNLREQLAAAESQIVARQPQFAAPDDNAELERLREEHSELLRLRGEVTLLKQEAREREALLNAKSLSRTQERRPNPVGFLASENWQNVGFETPANAFQSFLAALKSGSVEIDSMVQWEIGWKESPTDEDIALVENHVRITSKCFNGRHIKSLDSISPHPRKTEATELESTSKH